MALLQHLKDDLIIDTGTNLLPFSKRFFQKLLSSSNVLQIRKTKAGGKDKWLQFMKNCQDVILNNICTICQWSYHNLISCFLVFYCKYDNISLWTYVSLFTIKLKLNWIDWNRSKRIWNSSYFIGWIKPRLQNHKEIVTKQKHIKKKNSDTNITLGVLINHLIKYQLHP